LIDHAALGMVKDLGNGHGLIMAMDRADFKRRSIRAIEELTRRSVFVRLAAGVSRCS